MKKNTFIKNALLLFNYIVAFFLILSFFISILPQEKFILFGVLGIAVPIVIASNLFFVLYWIYKKSRGVLISLSLLVIAYFILPPIYKFEKNLKNKSDSDFSLMTFNTRSFNTSHVINQDNIDSLIINFVEVENPDIVCFQEFYYAMKRSSKLNQYPYKFVDFIDGENNKRVIQAIYSKFPILKVEPIEFPKSANSVIFADLLIKKDTVRVYNVHFQSFKISPEVNTLKNQNSKRLRGRLMKVLKLQKEQANIVKNHYLETNYKTIIAGDFNNTQFSNTYHILKDDFQDSFMEAGKGFGRTYNLKGLPMRIDYIMADVSFEILEHQNYDVELSDHYPIKARFKLKE